MASWLTSTCCFRRVAMLAFIAGLLFTTFAAAGDTKCKMHLCACAMHCCHEMPAGSPAGRVSSDCRSGHGAAGITDDDSEDATSVAALSGERHFAPDAVPVSMPDEVPASFGAPPGITADLVSVSEPSIHLINSVFRI